MEKNLEKLVVDHLYIAVVMARKYRNKGIDYNDLVQEGNYGLVKAAQRFDESRGVKFSTYATFWVKQAILDAVTTKSRTIRLPSHIVSAKLKIFHFMENFLLATGIEPDNAVISKELNISELKVRNIRNLTTEYTGAWEPEDVTLSIEELLLKEESDSLVLEAVRKLSPTEQLILGMRYGFVEDI